MTQAADSPVVFAPVSRAAVSEDIFRQLRDAILDGSLEPGTALPGERVLAAQFAVNRHAVREAMRRLEQARLVEVNHGGSTRVLDWRSHAGLELLGELATAGDLGAVLLLRSVVEMRLAVGIDAARLAAVRVDDDAAADLTGHVDRLLALDELPSDETLGAEYDALWRMIVRASDNLAYQLADNTLVEALHRFPDLSLQLSRPEIIDLAAQRALVEAIAAHDDVAAVAAARDLLERMVTSSVAVVDSA
ncbi:MAG: FadR family transcriptional regulator [Frankiaceae bacterium]|nr:FadR family transcriptional regulator [Frankiaceae bacterium]MBV9870905.1 FadR family transcriptional regulator [Frankiaceae bacterium]